MNTSPAEFIEQARLASDPVRALGAFRTIEALRRWTDARAGRAMHVTTVRAMPSDLVGMCEVRLYDGRALVAEYVSADFFDAVANALSIAGAL